MNIIAQSTADLGLTCPIHSDRSRYMSSAMIVIEANSTKEETTEELEVMLNLLEQREEAVGGRGCCARSKSMHKSLLVIPTSVLTRCL
jgi:hypothetical protein